MFFCLFHVKFWLLNLKTTVQNSVGFVFFFLNPKPNLISFIKNINYIHMFISDVLLLISQVPPHPPNPPSPWTPVDTSDV